MPSEGDAAERDYVTRNRAAWTDYAAEFVEAGEQAWASDEPHWGIWQIADSLVGVFPPDLAGKDTIELGCGTGYVSAWLARRGANPVGIDLTEAQLATARRLQQEHGLDFPLHTGNAEELPFADESFDLAISEYGACLWADPYRWIPEAARVLRPGGELIFLTNGWLSILTAPDDGSVSTNELQQDHFGLLRSEWPDWPSVEFHLSHGDWIRLLDANGFEVRDLIELQAPEGAETRHPDIVSLEWARRWPSEEVWKAQKRR